MNKNVIKEQNNLTYIFFKFSIVVNYTLQNSILTILLYTVKWHLVYWKCCTSITNCLQNCFIISEENPISIKQLLSIPSMPEPWSPLIHFLLLCCIYLSWIFHINECLGLNCVPTKRYIEVLIPSNVHFFGNRALADITS